MFWMPDDFIDGLIEEDLHLVDLTSQALELSGSRGAVEAAPKERIVVAGSEVAGRMFRRAGCRAEVKISSGQMAEARELIVKASGPGDRLHAVYKAAQNFMEYSSGIAGRCRLMVEKAKKASPHVEVLVTRKHMPGGKKLSLAAALAGGASIHRMGLSDSILIFDQHREFIGGIEGLTRALPGIKRRFPEKKLAAEVASIEEAVALAAAGIDVLQLERFNLAELKAAVRFIKAIRAETAVLAAGGLTADNAEAAAATGVDGLVTSWPYFGRPADVKMTFTKT